MKIVQSVSGKFHHFHLARQLFQRDVLEGIFSSYPPQKLWDEGILMDKVHSFPWVNLFERGVQRFGLTARQTWALSRWHRESFDAYVARHLPECDVLLAHSGSGLIAGKLAQTRGSRYVCDRGAAHIRFWSEFLPEEFARWGEVFPGVDPQDVAREEAEYAQADVITLPSRFAFRSFTDKGVPAEKIRVVPYGANLASFSKVADPDPETFEVLFVGAVSFLKGIPYLLEAFERLRHPKKRLTLVGAVLPEMARYLQRKSLENVELTGPLPSSRLPEMMSRSHVMVFPSLNDGFGMVMGEAMACGCPVIASTNSGGEHLIETGQEGFLIPIRDPGAIWERLNQLAQDPELRGRMGQASLLRVASLGGWDQYGAEMITVLTDLSGRREAAARPSSRGY